MSDLPDGWGEEPYDPERDEAPEGDPEHDCDGKHDDSDETDHRTIRGGGGTPADRGWGPGWPHCQFDKIATLVRSDGVRLPMRRELMPLAALLIDETERKGYNIRPTDTWGFACRSIRGSSTPSNHSWGLAFDFNAATNPMGYYHPPRTDMPGWMPDLWNRFGFRWGGDYSGRTDSMHYEFLGTPALLVHYTALAREEFAGEEGFLAKLTEEEQRDLYEKVKAIWKDHGDLKKDGTYVGVLEDVDRLGVRLDKIDAALARLEAQAKVDSG